jgi:hypothetical protein
MKSRTDLSIEQIPSPLPNVGGLLGKNTVYTDPVFGSKVCRITDGASAGNFDSMQTNVPGSYSNSNTNDTLLALQSTGGSTFFFQFDPATMQTTQLSLKVAGHGGFSNVKPNVYYLALGANHVLNGFTGNGMAIYALTFAQVNKVWALASVELLCDFAKMLPAGFKVLWQSEVDISRGDSVFSLSVSEHEQDTAYFSCLYKTGARGGYRVLNTQTMQVVGDWGKVGTVSLSNTTLTKFFLHGVNQTPNPLYTVLSPVGTGVLGGIVWANEGLEATQIELSGHHGIGFLSAYCSPGRGQFIQAPYADPAQHTKLIQQLPEYQTPPQTLVGDEHCGFGPISVTDESLLFISFGPPVVSPYTSCWMGEVVGLDVTGKVSGVKGTMYRICHTYNSGKSLEYIVTNSMAVPSKTGKFVWFTSDFFGVLGSIVGAATGTPGVDARGDVFGVRVQ